MSRFDQFADKYRDILDKCLAFSGDNSEYFADYKARYAVGCVGVGFSGKLLDYGCGVGLLSVFLKRYLPASRLHGYDISSASIRAVDETLTAQGQYTSEATHLDDDYDLIVLANVLHHIPMEMRQTTLSGLRGRLCETGKLLIFEHNPANPMTQWVVRQCPFDRDAVLLQPEEVMQYITESSLHLMEREYIHFFPRPLAWCRPLEKYFSWCPLGAQYVLVAGKQRAGESGSPNSLLSFV